MPIYNKKLSVSEQSVQQVPIQDLTNEQKAQFIKRCREDLYFFISTVLKIPNKYGERIDFIPNKSQEYVIEKIQRCIDSNDFSNCDLMLLKARQLGMSTLVCAISLWASMLFTGRKNLLVQKNSDEAKKLFRDRLLYMFNAIEPRFAFIKPRHVQKIGELIFPDIDSWVSIGSAESATLGRGTTLFLLHLSEMAHYQDDTFLAGLNECLPTDRRIIIAESTPNGRQGAFYNLYRNSVDYQYDLENDISGVRQYGYILFFFPWWNDAQYRISINEDTRNNYEYDERARQRDIELGLVPEDLLISDYGLDIEQVLWRRQKLSTMPFPRLFAQEYAETPEGCFLSSGQSKFDMMHINANHRQFIAEPVKRTEYVVTGGTFHLDVWEDPQPQSKYYLGVDVATGAGTPESKDYSVITVLKSNGDGGRVEQVARFRGRPIPDTLAHLAREIGVVYNNAFLVFEKNGVGQSFMDTIKRIYPSQRIYRKIYKDRLNDRVTQDIGFSTQERSKAAAIELMAKYLKHNDILIRDELWYNEAATFVVDERGKCGAEKGAHDDLIMSMIFAVVGVETPEIKAGVLGRTNI